MNDQSLSIFFATVTGNAEACAETLGLGLAVHGIAPCVRNLATSSPDAIRNAGTVIFVVSTWDDGEPPDDAIDIWNQILALPAGFFGGLRYAIVALGDSSYEIFCGFGIDLDKGLERLGGVRIHDTILCDVDWEEPVREWMPGLLQKLNAVETCQ